ncbi:hypothetical protein [Sessilibacter corallicola]|uniref:Uncharacterized protein n=1 Tax=Sessilibacter corallicola TaxID=2904075 RepID=A0ABQ0A9L0_9GAMM
MTIDYLKPYQTDTVETGSLPDREIVAQALINEVVETLDNRIQETIDQQQIGLHSHNSDYQPIDLSHISKEVWETLNQMDDSPFAQLINGVVYATVETAAHIVEVSYNQLASHYGEKLITSVNDPESYQQIVNDVTTQLQEQIIVPVELTNTTRDAEHIHGQVHDHLGRYLSQSARLSETSDPSVSIEHDRGIER